jgi:DNA-binding MarR family transcriptional regulator
VERAVPMHATRPAAQLTGGEDRIASYEPPGGWIDAGTVHKTRSTARRAGQAARPRERAWLGARARHRVLRPAGRLDILSAALTIYPSRKTVEHLPADRPTLIAQLTDELSNRGPKEALHHMRHWPSGRLSLVHLNVLMTLRDEPLPMGALAEALDVSHASVTGIVDRMEQRGLVERQRDDTDRRVVRVAVTDEGRRLTGLLADQRREHLALLLDDLTTDELTGFLVGVRAMRRARERWIQQTDTGATA